MRRHQVFVALLALSALLATSSFLTVDACSPVSRSGKAVVNADQNVIIIWDRVNKIEHFIRKATFKSNAEEIGFLIPTPSRPELEESGDAAFDFLAKLTAPEIIQVARGGGCGCASATKSMAAATRASVWVVEQKQVAGYQATVLAASSATALVGWLNDHQYAFSPEVEAWAKPYVEQGWMITALRLAPNNKDPNLKNISASALRLTFKTDRPLFPYREPDSKAAAQALDAKQRLLRIFFIAESKYEGELTKEQKWTGKIAWSNQLSSADRTKLNEQLKLPASAGPASYWLTEYEDNWPYQVAPADVYFARSDDQRPIQREPIQIGSRSGDPAFYFVCCLVVVSLARRVRAKTSKANR
jgi:hypothetical protein